VLRLLLVAACCAGCGGFMLGRVPAPMRVSHPAGSAAVAPMLSPVAKRSGMARVHMQQETIDDASAAFYDEYVETDPVTGESKTISLDDKERLYLECLDAYYNENGKQLLPDSEYEKLKLDLDFDGSKVAVYSKDEIKFLLANKRFKMGKPVMDDKEYDELRNKLKTVGSLVVLHEGASCSVDGLCKTDMREDAGKTRLLYLPGTAGGLILVCELIFWTLGLDPILSIVLGSLPAYFFGVWFTENVFAQKPLVVQATCPNCNYLQNIYFGDLFSVMTDGMAGPAAVPGDEIVCKCPNCGSQNTANRDTMLLVGEKDLAKV